MCRAYRHHRRERHHRVIWVNGAHTAPNIKTRTDGQHPDAAQRPSVLAQRRAALRGRRRQARASRHTQSERSLNTLQEFPWRRHERSKGHIMHTHTTWDSIYDRHTAGKESLHCGHAILSAQVTSTSTLLLYTRETPQQNRGQAEEMHVCKHDHTSCTAPAPARPQGSR